MGGAGGNLRPSIWEKLRLQFFIAGQKDLDKRRISQRFAGSPDFGKTLALAEHANEGFRIATPFASGTPTVIVVPVAASSPNRLYVNTDRCDWPAP